MPQDIIVNGMLWNGVASIDVLGENGETIRYYSHGAYYTPTVDEEGNLLWTPVREDMPEIPIANIRGPQGAGGIKKIVDFSISPNQWKENSNSDDEYKLYYDFNDKDISEDILLFMVLSEECLENACCCGLCPTVISYEGYAQIKCVERPKTEMKGTCYLIDETIPMIPGSGSSLSKEELMAVIEEYFKKNPAANGGLARNGIPSGGRAGQYLRKVSDSDYDVEWADLEIPSEYGLVTYDNTKTLTIT